MKRNTACLFLFGSLLSISGMAQTKIAYRPEEII